MLAVVHRLASLLTVVVVVACAAGPSTQAPTPSTSPVASSLSVPPAVSPSTAAAETAAPTARASTGSPPAESSTPNGPFTIEQLASGTDGIAAIGYEQQESGAAGILLVGEPDGLVWSLFRAAASPGWLKAIADGPAGLRGVVAEATGLRIIGSSDRGASWNTIATIPDAIAGTLVGGRAGYLLTGYRNVAGTGRAATWLSPDGLRWDDAITLSGFLNPPTAVALPDGFLLVDDGSASLQARLALVTSAGVRGLIAGELRLGSRVYLPAATIAGDDLLVVRQDGAGATLWHVPAASVGAATFMPVPAALRFLVGASVASVASGAAGTVLLAWDRATLARFALTSSDGVTWTRHALDRVAFGGGVPRALVATGGAFVAIGRAVTLAGGADDLWRSADGLTWSLAPAPVGPPPPVHAGPCPPAPATLDELAAIGAPKAASCFGRQDLRISAYIGTCGGCGGTTLYQWTPPWLGGMFAPLYLAPEVETASTNGADSAGAAWPDPAYHVVVPPEKTPVWVTGHYNDPAASTCRVVPIDGLPGGLPSIDEAITTCQRLYVVTAIGVRR